MSFPQKEKAKKSFSLARREEKERHDEGFRWKRR